MKLLVDMNLTPRWVRALADANIGAVHWSDAGAHNASDSEIMHYAQVNGYIVLTHDLDFGGILAATQGTKPSVVQIRASDVTPEAIGKSVIVALKQMESELEKGALITIDPQPARLRVLPLLSRAEESG
jgi:predicted nuclease of predicted toxin-antitoxin system